MLLHLVFAKYPSLSLHNPWRKLLKVCATVTRFKQLQFNQQSNFIYLMMLQMWSSHLKRMLHTQESRRSLQAFAVFWLFTSWTPISYEQKQNLDRRASMAISKGHHTGLQKAILLKFCL